MNSNTKPSAQDRLDEIMAWSDNRRRHIEADERFRNRAADVTVNAPLALIQVGLKAEHRALCAVLAIARGETWTPDAQATGHAPRQSEGGQ